MTVKELVESLRKWNDDDEVEVWVGDMEGLRICAVNEPAPFVPNAIILVEVVN